MILPKSQASDVSNMFLTSFSLPTFISEVYLRGLRNFSQRASTKLALSKVSQETGVLLYFSSCFKNLQNNSTSLKNDMDGVGAFGVYNDPSPLT